MTIPILSKVNNKNACLSGGKPIPASESPETNRNYNMGGLMWFTTGDTIA